MVNQILGFIIVNVFLLAIIFMVCYNKHKTAEDIFKEVIQIYLSSWAAIAAIAFVFWLCGK